MNFRDLDVIRSSDKRKCTVYKVRVVIEKVSSKGNAIRRLVLQSKHIFIRTPLTTRPKISILINFFNTGSGGRFH